jgi:hypothetical protein
MRNAAYLAHLTTSEMATLNCRLQYKSEPLKSFLINPSTRFSNYIILDYVQLLAALFLLFYCTEFYIYCLYILSRIPPLSIFITANAMYTQPGEEQPVTKKSRKTC